MIRRARRYLLASVALAAMACGPAVAQSLDALRSATWRVKPSVRGEVIFHRYPSVSSDILDRMARRRSDLRVFYCLFGGLPPELWFVLSEQNQVDFMRHGAWCFFAGAEGGPIGWSNMANFERTPE